MTFDADYPFDVDVCEKFNAHMCDMGFTGIDHMAESLDAPPEFEMIEYVDMKYEKAEYQDVEYEDPPM